MKKKKDVYHLAHCNELHYLNWKGKKFYEHQRILPVIDQASMAFVAESRKQMLFL